MLFFFFNYSPPPFFFFFCSAVEQPDVIFSVEQIRCVQQLKAEPQSPAVIPGDCGTDICDSEPENEHLPGSLQLEDAGSNPSSTAHLFPKLKKPEELLQLAPEAGDTIVPLTGGQTYSNLLEYQWLFLEKLSVKLIAFPRWEPTTVPYKTSLKIKLCTFVQAVTEVYLLLLLINKKKVWDFVSTVVLWSKSCICSIMVLSRFCLP